MTPNDSDDITSAQDTSCNDARVDGQDGGPGSHTDDGSGGQSHDVASGGGPGSNDDEDGLETDVHGDPDTVS